MLRALEIRDFVIVEAASLELERGFSVLTGETGAGKSILVDAIEKAKEAIKEGESIAVTLKKSGHFPPIVTHMIAVGEKSGQLEHMLEMVAQSYEDEVEMKLQKLTSMLEPIMLVVMGGAIAFVVFSILMPIMDMQNIASPGGGK